MATKKKTLEKFAAKIYDKSKLLQDANRRSSCVREVMILSRIQHANIARFVEAFETDS